METELPLNYEYRRNGTTISVELCSNCSRGFPVPRDTKGVGLLLSCPVCGKHVFGGYDDSYQKVIHEWNRINQ